MASNIIIHQPYVSKILNNGQRIEDVNVHVGGRPSHLKDALLCACVQCVIHIQTSFSQKRLTVLASH